MLLIARDFCQHGSWAESAILEIRDNFTMCIIILKFGDGDGPNNNG